MVAYTISQLIGLHRCGQEVHYRIQLHLDVLCRCSPRLRRSLLVLRIFVDPQPQIQMDQELGSPEDDLIIGPTLGRKLRAEDTFLWKFPYLTHCGNYNFLY